MQEQSGASQVLIGESDIGEGAEAELPFPLSP
jgi:hypothetical protein